MDEPTKESGACLCSICSQRRTALKIPKTLEQQLPKDGSSTSKFSGEASDSTIQINMMTLDFEIHSFAVDKNMQVLLFEKTLATVVDVSVCQKRPIFTGNFLKDDHLLSEYHLENGHTLHLVARWPSLVQESFDALCWTNKQEYRYSSDAKSGDLHNRPILNALSTVSEFMQFMEATESQNGNRYQQSTSSVSHENLPIMELATNRSGLPTPEALSSILRLANSLLSGHTVATLSISSLFGNPVPSTNIHTNARLLTHLEPTLGPVFESDTVCSLEPTMPPGMSAVGTGVNNGDATVSTSPMALDLDGSIGVVPARNVDVADEALLAVVESTSHSQGNGVSVTEDHMDDASSHSSSSVEDHLNELMRVLNYIHESITMLQQERRLHVDYLGEDG